jgi:hypothetical protein
MSSIFLTTRHLRVGARIFRRGAGYSGGRRWPRLRQFRSVASFDHPIGAYAQAAQQQRPAPRDAARSGVSHDFIRRLRQFAPTQRRQSRAVSLPPLRVPDLRTLRVERLLDREAAVGVVHVVVDDQVMKLLRLARRRHQRQQQYFAQPELKRRRAAVHAGSPVFISVNEIGHDLFGAHQNSQQRSLITGKHHRFRRWQPKRFGFPIGTTAYAFACALTKASARAKTRTYLKIV